MPECRNPLTDALQHDPDAEWASDEHDENCLLVSPEAVPPLLEMYESPYSYAAYEDPNPTAAHTRVVFPRFRTDSL